MIKEIDMSENKMINHTTNTCANSLNKHKMFLPKGFLGSSPNKITLEIPPNIPNVTFKYDFIFLTIRLLTHYTTLLIPRHSLDKTYRVEQHGRFSSDGSYKENYRGDIILHSATDTHLKFSLYMFGYVKSYIGANRSIYQDWHLRDDNGLYCITEVLLL